MVHSWLGAHSRRPHWFALRLLPRVVRCGLLVYGGCDGSVLVVGPWLSRTASPCCLRPRYSRVPGLLWVSIDLDPVYSDLMILKMPMTSSGSPSTTTSSTLSSLWMLKLAPRLPSDGVYAMWMTFHPAPVRDGAFLDGARIAADVSPWCSGWSWSA